MFVYVLIFKQRREDNEQIKTKTENRYHEVNENTH